MKSLILLLLISPCIFADIPTMEQDQAQSDAAFQELEQTKQMQEQTDQMQQQTDIMDQQLQLEQQKYNDNEWVGDSNDR